MKAAGGRPRRSAWIVSGSAAIAFAGTALLCACTSSSAQAPPDWRQTGRSDASFQAPSLAPGVDYTVPAEADITSALARVRGWFERSTPYRVVDTATGQAVTDLSKPSKTVGIDLKPGEFNDWTYPMGVVLAGMLQATDVTGDPAYEKYTFRNFDFIFDHLDYFRAQAKAFGPQAYGYRRLLDMKELDDCGAIGAALVKAYAKKNDPRYRAAIDVVAEFISHKMTRLPDGTLARQRPQWPTVWSDDAYMSVPFLAQMGHLTGDRRYYDDAAKQVVNYSAHLMDPATGLFDHAWFVSAGENDPKFHWARGDAWVVMAMAELLSVLPESHPQRKRVLEIFQRSVRGHVELQSPTGFWHQLVDRPDTYLETSATAMYTFAIARGVNRGWLPPLYGPVAQAGWQAVAQRVRADGQVEGICYATTAAYDAVYYANRPTRLDAMQGYGPVLMAGSEMIAMLRQFDIDHTLNTFHYRPKGTPKAGGGPK
jgi:rhamnogalacturonyl hydrolase YesR